MLQAQGPYPVNLDGLGPKPTELVAKGSSMGREYMDLRVATMPNLFFWPKDVTLLIWSRSIKGFSS